MSDPDLAARLAAVEQAWDIWTGPNPSLGKSQDYTAAMTHLVAVLRAAREQGMVPVMISTEAVEALRKVQKARAERGFAAALWSGTPEALDLLARDLAALLKESQ